MSKTGFGTYDGFDVIERGLNIPIDIKVWMDREYLPFRSIGIDWDRSETQKLWNMVRNDLLDSTTSEGQAFDNLVTLIEKHMNFRCGTSGILSCSVPSGHIYRIYLIPKGTEAVNMLVDHLREHARVSRLYR